jgi:uncharacterized protein with ParB-like and HNH nuclease domain
VVWPENKQMRLIDSLYHNYYIPPLVFAIVIENGGEIRRCVDGKQRLTSIQRFIDGEVRISPFTSLYLLFVTRYRFPVGIPSA